MERMEQMEQMENRWKTDGEQMEQMENNHWRCPSLWLVPIREMKLLTGTRAVGTTTIGRLPTVRLNQTGT
jgi:hypothetical protein